MISTDGQVDLDERIWMNKLSDHNKHSKELIGSLLGSQLTEEY